MTYDKTVAELVRKFGARITKWYISIKDFPGLRVTACHRRNKPGE